MNHEELERIRTRDQLAKGRGDLLTGCEADRAELLKDVDRLDALRLAVRTELANLENELGGIGPIPEPLERLRQIVGPR